MEIRLSVKVLVFASNSKAKDSILGKTFMEIHNLIIFAKMILKLIVKIIGWVFWGILILNVVAVCVLIFLAVFCGITSYQAEQDEIKSITDTFTKNTPTTTIVSFLSDDRLQVRREAAYALRDRGDPNATVALIPLLDEEDSRVGWPIDYCAERALIAIGNAAVDPLIQGLSSSKGEGLVNRIEILHEIGSPRAIEPMISLLLESQESPKWPLARALFTLTGGSVVDLDKCLANEEIQKVAAAYPYFLLKLGNSDSRYNIERVLVAALDAYGTREMAEDFLIASEDDVVAFGAKPKSTLGKAAAKWAEEHGYNIVLRKRY